MGIFWPKMSKPDSMISHSLIEVKRELMQKSKMVKKQSLKHYDLSATEKILVQEIIEKTEKLNLNNVTRTQAYFRFYERHPEIHWALLGHMVSRNGGWNMTDLKGELISKLLTEREQHAFFSFLERGNWLIFQDAYPQFLLYEESLSRNKNLFHLLPSFKVSTFMETIWNYFWKYDDRYVLAIALVINEQSYLEKRVIQNPELKQGVLDTFEFMLQDILSLNHILFPFYNNENKEEQATVIGQPLRHFSSLHERILLGKRLYSLLFHNQDIMKKVMCWAKQNPHTGSRIDYWPHLFHDIKETVPGTPYRRRLKKCQLRDGVNRLYSPRFVFAWKDVLHQKAESGDWFHDWSVIKYLNNENREVKGEIKGEYCEALEKIEFAILAKKTIFH